MKKRKIIIILGIIFLILILSLITHYIDSARVRNSKEPKFVVKIISNDGNKITYWGLGYKVIRYPSVSPNEPYKNNRGVKYGSWFMTYSLERYEHIKKDIDEEVERYIYVIAPKCEPHSSTPLITHEDLVYNAGMDKEKLLDIDEKSYCKVYVDTTCIEKGKWSWKTYISCEDYTDKDAYCVVFMDMDGLKKINDAYGHDAGNVALKITADVIKKAAHENDLVTRCGGDEFQVLSSSVDINFWESMQQNINDEIDRQIAEQKLPYVFSVSFGYCISDKENQLTFEECCDKADTLMYANKKERKAERVE